MYRDAELFSRVEHLESVIRELVDTCAIYSERIVELENKDIVERSDIRAMAIDACRREERLKRLMS